MRKILFVILLSQAALAAENTCWQHEINAQTQQIYSSEIEYNQDKHNWHTRTSWANPILLLKAYKVYQQEKANSQTLETDKMSHCYMGCRMRQRTDLRTVRYVAWMKEAMDLSDCNPESHFEVADFNATVLGGTFQLPNAASCVQKCRAELPRIGLH